MRRYAVGIDIGGTKTAVGLVDGTGQVVADVTLPTDLSVTPQEMIDRICRTIRKLLAERGMAPETLVGIGIGAPGPLDAKNGIITCPPNLSGWREIPIVEQLRSSFPVPIRLENDANAATLAEKWIGAARESDNFLYMTISTGIGAGLFLDGRLYPGFRGNAGDVGHIVIDPAYGRCPCGQDGCFEWIASGTAIARQASQLLERPVTTREVFALYEQQHPAISRLVEEIFDKIGVGCVTLINLFDPEMIVIGGGVSQAGEPLFDAVRRYVGKHALNPSGRRTRIVASALRQHAGLIGAAALLFGRGEGAGQCEAVSG
jgi:glucokinase